MRLALVAWLCLLPLVAQAHPSHTSFAEIAWSESGEQLEVALRVIPEDLEDVLALREQRKVALFFTDRMQVMLETWLRDDFAVSDGENDLKPEVLGMEVDHRAAWIYFTIDADAGRELTLAYRLLQRMNRDRGQVQINTLQRLWQPANDRLSFTDTSPQLIWVPGP